MLACGCQSGLSSNHGVIITASLWIFDTVEAKQIHVSIAVEIAGASDEEMQVVLQQAYERKLLRGHKLIAAKRLIEQRRRRGQRPQINRREKTLSSTALLRAHREDVDRKRPLIQKANATRNRLIFSPEIRKLFAGANLVTILRAEGLDTPPQNLADRLREGAPA
jgi:ParB family transcriptional regulator, chromosome partitioning protein